MLGIADEDGWVKILDSRKTGQRSIIKGITQIYFIPLYIFSFQNISFMIF